MIPEVALLMVGHELLTGAVQDLNTPYLARALYSQGAKLAKVEIVEDDPKAIAQGVKELLSYDYLLTSGGLGPTHDDRTVEGVALALGHPLQYHPQLRLALERHYQTTDLSKAQLQMALAPQGAQLYPLPEPPTLGFLPLVKVDKIYLLPGVPRLFAYYCQLILPELSGPPLYRSALTIYERESLLAPLIARLAERFATLTVGSYPQYDARQPNLFQVSIRLEGRDSSQLQAALSYLISQIPSAWRWELEEAPAKA